MPPSALDILRPGAYRAPRVLPEEEGYGDFITDADVREAQMENVRPLDAHGNYGYIPSREEIRADKYQSLRRAMGMEAIRQRSEERKTLLPIQAKGQYALASEGIKAETARQNALAAREAAAARDAAALQRVQTQQTGAGERAQVAERGRTQRVGAQQTAMAGRQRQNLLNQRIMDVTTGKTKVPTSGMWEYFMGPGKSGRARAIAELQQQFGGAEEQSIQDLAARVQSERAQSGASLEDILSGLDVDIEALTPEELVILGGQ